MLLTRSLFYRIVFLVPVLFSLMLGVSSCATKVAAFTPLTVLSIVGGNVEIQQPGTSNWTNGKEGITLEAGDKVKTDAGATATITFFDGSTIELNGSTEISLDELLSKSSTSPKTIKIGQTIGETSSSIVKLVDPASHYEVDTQAGVAAVGGSKMVVTVATDGTTGVYNLEGIISFTAQGQEVMIPVGSVSTATPGQVPSTPQPGTPPLINATGVTSISSQTGWQQTGLYLNAGDKFYVDYSGGSWTVDYKNFPYVGPAGYTADIDKTIVPGYKFDASVPYGYLLGEVDNGKEIRIGDNSGPYTTDVSGFLSLRINDSDATLGDDDGAITVNLWTTSYSALNDFSTTNENPNGAWSYGWMPTDFSLFNLYVFNTPFMWYGNLSSDLTPYIWINNGNGTPPGVVNNGGVASGVPVGWLSLHPGPAEQPSVLRWTAPIAGNIHITGQFLAGDTGIMDVAVRHNNQNLWTATDSGSFKLNIRVNASDTIDFVVYNGYGWGNTPISAIISY